MCAIEELIIIIVSMCRVGWVFTTMYVCFLVSYFVHTIILYGGRRQTASYVSRRLPVHIQHCQLIILSTKTCLWYKN